MLTEIISIGFAFIYYVFCVVFLCENLQEKTNSILNAEEVERMRMKRILMKVLGTYKE